MPPLYAANLFVSPSNRIYTARDYEYDRARLPNLMQAAEQALAAAEASQTSAGAQAWVEQARKLWAEVRVVQNHLDHFVRLSQQIWN